MVAAAALVAVGAGAIVPSRGDPDVELPADTSLGTIARLSAEEVTRLRQQVDPNRLRCEPRGCEVWRRSLRSSHLQGAGRVVILFEEHALIGLDATTGDEQWSTPLTDLLLDTRGVASPQFWDVVHGADGVLVGNPGSLAFVDLDGAVRWRTPTRGGEIWYAEFHDPFLVVNGQSAGEPFVAAFASDDGAVMWWHDGAEMYATRGGRALLYGGDRFEVVELADGRPVWDSSDPASADGSGNRGGDAWLSGEHLVLVREETRVVEVVDLDRARRSWTSTYSSDGWPAVTDTWVALPRADGDLAIHLVAGGEVVTVFEARRVIDWTIVGDRSVLLLGPASNYVADRHEPGTASLVALDDGGEVAWRRPVPLPRRCCAWVWQDESGAVSVHDEDAAPDEVILRMDVATGEPLATSTPTTSGVHTWASADGTRFEWHDTGVTIRTGDRGARIEPGGVWPQTDAAPWVFANEFEVIGVQLMPDGAD